MRFISVFTILVRKE